VRGRVSRNVSLGGIVTLGEGRSSLGVYCGILLPLKRSKFPGLGAPWADKVQCADRECDLMFKCQDRGEGDDKGL